MLCAALLVLLLCTSGLDTLARVDYVARRGAVRPEGGFRWIDGAHRRDAVSKGSRWFGVRGLGTLHGVLAGRAWRTLWILWDLSALVQYRTSNSGLKFRSRKPIDRQRNKLAVRVHSY